MLRYERPTTIEEAVRCVGDGATPIAGGTDLIPRLRDGRKPVRHVVDLKHVPGLLAIERQADGSWRLGAAASIRGMANHERFSAEHRALVASARLIGSVQIQSRATLAGNLCNAAPSADAVPLLIALGASAEIAGPKGRRLVPVEEVPTGPGRTSLQSSELLTALVLPASGPQTAACYLRMTPRREMDIAIAGAGIAFTLDAKGIISRARVVLAAVAPTPLRATEAEAMLVGAKPSAMLFDAAGLTAAREAKPISDMRGSADYRREIVAVLTRRALAAAAAELGCPVS
ncbi:MAG TPA: xanthine dehydrogenase family protein subunit M [Hyphomicrobiaceae bacterium]|nr:xanthine dehydrogenase family protein subunit M [Hyphomicrobiaceae bacterium]